MTMHISDMMLIELAGGQLPTDTAAQVTEHLAQCTSCARRYRQFEQTWQLLGQWQPVAQSDPLPAMSLGASDSYKEPAVIAAIGPRFSLAGALRVAAAMLLAAGLGAAAGMLGTGTTSQPVSQQHESAAWLEQTPWQIWHEPTPAGLADPLLTLLPPDQQEKRS